jgi:hypothetical protein
MRRRAGPLVATLALVVGLMATAAPAWGTVHEITGMLCSLKSEGGTAIFNPPGVTGENGESDRGEANLALPLFATGFATFVPGGGPDGDDLIVLDEDHPASKITLTGGLFEVEDGLWVTDFTFDQGAWQHCFGP